MVAEHKRQLGEKGVNSIQVFTTGASLTHRKKNAPVALKKMVEPDGIEPTTS